MLRRLSSRSLCSELSPFLCVSPRVKYGVGVHSIHVRFLGLILDLLWPSCTR